MRKELSNVMMKLSNMRKKVREPPNVKKNLINVILELHNIRKKPSNIRKSKGATKYDKITITCDIEVILKQRNIRVKPSCARKKSR